MIELNIETYEFHMNIAEFFSIRNKKDIDLILLNLKNKIY